MALFKRDVAKRGLSINQGLRQQIRGLESQQIAPEITQADQEAQMMKNRGMSSAALGLFKQQADRSQAAAMSQLGGRRSALAGVGAIVQGGQDAGLKLANMEDEARQQNMMAARSSAANLGQQKMGLQKYKQEGLFNYYMGKKQARQAQWNSLLNAGVMLGSAALGKPKVQ
jgi:hypothetical protein